MQNHLKRFLRDEEGSVVQTVLLAAGGVGLAAAVMPLIGADASHGAAVDGQLLSNTNTLLGN